jgi:hypothetical protein
MLNKLKNQLKKNTMKKLYILLILGLFCLKSISQININSNVVIETTKLNVVYAGLENPLSIAVSDILPEYIYLTTNKGILKGINGNYMLWLPFQEQGTVDITINNISTGQMEKIETRSFRIKAVPKPVAYFASKVSGDITPDEVKSVDFITPRLDDFAFEGLKFTVKKFKLIYVPKKGNAQPFEANSAALTPDMKLTLSKAVKGSIIMVYDIFISFPGSPDIRLPSSLFLTVADTEK